MKNTSSSLGAAPQRQARRGAVERRFEHLALLALDGSADATQTCRAETYWCRASNSANSPMKGEAISALTLQSRRMGPSG